MIIILEGMSTAGKTMIQKELVDILEKNKVRYRVVMQNEGLPPETFIHYDSKKSLDFMLNFLQSINKEQVVILDRFQLSHIAITNGSVDDFKMVENELIKLDAILVLLTINEDKIKERILGAIEHRGERWSDEIARKGKTPEEIEAWFLGTQNKLKNLHEQSILPKETFDTSNSNFTEIAQIIFGKYVGKK